VKQVCETYSEVKDDEISGGHCCEMLVSGSGLNNSLGGEGDQTDTETLEDLNNDYFSSGIGTGSETNHQTISEGLDSEPQDQSGL
jgi:hypothetical protein